MKIKILAKNTAEQIAAGEVIENPSSVVKELVENALDAGATKISVELENGGKTLICVTDNGHGMDPPELPLAFRRFATSKLTVLEDLDTLSSLGFRGEALPSIAAIAKVRLTSRTKEALSGAAITLEGGEVLEQEEMGTPPGTRVEVSSLFFNTPGRLKFLRSDSVETARVSYLLSEMSLAHPGTAFTLTSGKRKLFSSSGDGILRHAIGSLYGSETSEAMIALESTGREGGLSVNGFISAPYLTRSSRRWITLVVNGRLVRNPLIVSALERAYGDLLPGRRHPLAVLCLSVPRENIDVNVHPAKIEIRLREPEKVKNLVYKTVRLTLQGENITPQWPAAGEPVRDMPRQGFSHRLEQSENTFPGPAARPEIYPPTDREIKHAFPSLREDSGAEIEPGPGTDSCLLIGQFLQSYLVAQKGESLLLIDQHAAHERIIYHRLKQSERPVKKEDGMQLTIPLTLELPAAWREEMPRLLPLLKESGFDLEPLGEDSYVIRSVPFMLSHNIDSSRLYDLVETLVTADYNSEEEYREAILKSIACQRAVKAKQTLTRDEMERLLTEWESTPFAGYCPHGRPTVINFDRAGLEKGFHRRGSNQ